MKNPSQLALILSIIERGGGNRLTALYSDHQVFTHLRCEGTGTATSEIMDILGLGSSEKDIILSLAPIPAARALLDALDDDLRGSVPGRGIACTAPLSAVSNLMATVINTRTKLSEKESGDMEPQTTKNCLILVTVNQGYTDAVMDTARRHGARGGTIIRGRWVGEEAFEELQGVSRQAEKEIIAIVVPRELRGAIMENINRQHGLQSEAGAMVFSLGIDQMVHLG